MDKLLYIDIYLNGVKHKLNGKYLELKSEYKDIYTMAYITPSLSKNSIALVSTINDMFSEYSMVKYFGGNKDLNCKETRYMYEILVSYFINLIISKMYTITNINIKYLGENNEYVCLLAQCTNIIRAGIKKYARLRTLISEHKCRKEDLNESNHIEYKCNLPIGPYNQCPTFEHLRTIKGKTCKQIIKSSKSPSMIISLAARLLPSYKKQKNIRNIIFRRNRTRTRKSRNTRNRIRENIDIININTINNLINMNTPYKSVHIINSKNIPEVSNNE